MDQKWESGNPSFACIPRVSGSVAMARRVQKTRLTCAISTRNRADDGSYVIHSVGDTLQGKGTPRFFSLFAGISEVRVGNKGNPVESGSDGFNSD
jgi:hypothetical protein